MNSSHLVRIFQNWQYWAGQSSLQPILTCKKSISKRCTTVNTKFSLQRGCILTFVISLLTFIQALYKKKEFKVSFCSRTTVEEKDMSQDRKAQLLFFFQTTDLSIFFYNQQAQETLFQPPMPSWATFLQTRDIEKRLYLF